LGQEDPVTGDDELSGGNSDLAPLNPGISLQAPPLAETCEERIRRFALKLAVRPDVISVSGSSDDAEGGEDDSTPALDLPTPLKLRPPKPNEAILKVSRIRLPKQPTASESKMPGQKITSWFSHTWDSVTDSEAQEVPPINNLEVAPTPESQSAPDTEDNPTALGSVSSPVKDRDAEIGGSTPGRRQRNASEVHPSRQEGKGSEDDTADGPPRC